jgi:Flp pilus assembly protein TadG
MLNQQLGKVIYSGLQMRAAVGQVFNLPGERRCSVGQVKNLPYGAARICKPLYRNTRSGLLGRERGAYLAEFSVIGSVLVLFLFGILEFGRAIWVYNSIAHSVREGTRYAIVRGEESGRTASADDIRDYVRERAGINTLQVTTTWSPNKKAGSVVQVQANFDFQPVVQLLPSFTMSSTSRMVISF